MTNRKQKIKHILENFDFLRVHKTMEALEWSYHDTDRQVPTVGKLMTVAKELLEKVEDNNSIESGGFRVTTKGDDLELIFKVCGWDSEFYDEREG